MTILIGVLTKPTFSGGPGGVGPASGPRADFVRQVLICRTLRTWCALNNAPREGAASDCESGEACKYIIWYIIPLALAVLVYYLQIIRDADFCTRRVHIAALLGHLCSENTFTSHDNSIEGRGLVSNGLWL